jgi:hypothetical protein
MLDPIQYEFGFFLTTLSDPEPGAGAETSIFRLQLQPKVPAPCGSGSTTLLNVYNIPYSLVKLKHNLKGKLFPKNIDVKLNKK